MLFATSPTEQNNCEYSIHFTFRTHGLPYISAVVFYTPISFWKFNEHITETNALDQFINKLPQKSSARFGLLLIFSSTKQVQDSLG